MATITTRSGKGSTLTYAELDGNFTSINTELADKLEATDVTAGDGVSVTTDTAGDVVVAIDSTANITPASVEAPVVFKAKNTSGGTIYKGQALYITGVSGDVPTCDLARANSSSTMPAFGLATADANNNAEVFVTTFGNLSSVDTTDTNITGDTLAVGETLYVSASAAGKLTNTKPSGATDLIQNIAKVVRAHASAGVLKVGGAGRTNDTPNTIDIPGSISASTASFTNTTTDDTILLTTTEDSSTAAPVLTFKRNSGSPANGDYLGQLKFKGENDADQEVVYAKITAKISDDTDSTEDGILEFANRKAGSNNIGMRLTSTELKMLNGTKLDMGSHQIDDASQILVNNAPTFTESSTPIQLTGTQPNAGGYYTHTSINTGTSRGGIGYRSNTAAGGSSKVDTHMLYFDLDDDFGLRPTGAFQGDHNIWFQGNHTNDRVDMFFDGFSTAAISAFGHFGNGYGYQDLDLVGANVRLKGSGTTIATVNSSAMTFNAGELDMNGNPLKTGGANIDLEGGSLLSTGGSVDFADNTSVTITSAGTVAFTTTNLSATGSGVRIEVGTPSTANHTNGDILMVRRARGSGYQELFKINSIGGDAGEGQITMNNIDQITNQDTQSTSGTYTLEEYMEVVVNGNQRYIPLYSRA